MCTFALAEIQLQDGLQERVGVERELKLGAHLGLQVAFDPLVLRRRHALDQSVRNLWLEVGWGRQQAAAIKINTVRRA